MQKESVTLKGDRLHVTSRRGRSDRAGLVSFFLLSIFLWIGIAVLGIFIVAATEEQAPTSYENYVTQSVSPERSLIEQASQIGVGIAAWFLFFVLCSLTARWVLSRYRRFKDVEIALNAEAIQVKRTTFAYEKIKAVNVEKLPQFRGILMWVLALVLRFIDKVTMLVFGRILPASLKAAPVEECFYVRLNYGAMGLPRAMPIGTFYDVNVALEAAGHLQEAVERNQAASSGI